MRRGNIYYIYRRHTLGAEIANARPAVIVSNDALNATSGVVEVVYLTTSPKKEMPSHAQIEATGITSTALCEQVDTISKQLIGHYCGTCTEEEMRAIDKALLWSLGVTVEPDEEPTSIDVSESLVTIARVMAERDIYKEMTDKLLRGVIGD